MINVQNEQLLLEVNGQTLTLEDYANVLYRGYKVAISEEAMDKVTQSHEFLKAYTQDKIIYGINTGFGPMAQYIIEQDDQIELQYNLIRSHCAGSGKPLDHLLVKSILLTRLNNLVAGKSGVHRQIVDVLTAMLNHDICPVIYEHGGLGASGDLTQLAHVALSVIGEGEVTLKGEKMPTSEAFAQYNIEPAQIHLREGLAVMNGTAAMTGMAAVNLLHSQNLLRWSLVASAMISEIVSSFDDYFSLSLNAAKQHTGQQEIAGQLRKLLSGSQLLRKRSDHLYDQKKLENYLDKNKVQEYYSIRCTPQILGPILETIEQASQTVIREANSVSDNPVIDIEQQEIYHGGNFHGDYVSLEMDKLKIAITKLSMLVERQLNFLLNNKLNQLLPPFVNLGTIGLNLGMQGAQFVATSTTAESQSLSYPMYLHSIPSNNDNQDIVSMGSNAAILSNKVINNTYEVMAVHFLTLIQAVDSLSIKEKLSHKTQAIYQELRELVPVFQEDKVMYRKLAVITTFLKDNFINP